jgi:FkbM family methyltransferase
MTIDFLTSHCGKGDIVHAGAYFGDFLPALSRACAEGATIWAFEPLVDNYRCALITMEINNIRNVELTRAALGACEDSLEMLTIDENGQPLGDGNRVLSQDAPPSLGRTETVQVVAIDEVVPPHRHVSIIHLDVEGHESQALAGAQETIRRCSPIIVAETWQEVDSPAGESLLQLGYRRLKEIHMNTVFVRE